MSSTRGRVPERIRWAVDLLDPGGAERILEIGCGPGVAAMLICAQLSTGRLLAIDRSAVAVERTTRRNADHIASGRLEVRRCTLDAGAASLGPGPFDKALAVDVNLFWVRDPAAELEVLRGVLRPGGLLHVLYGAGGPTSASRITDPIAAALRAQGFTDVRSVRSGAGIGVIGVAGIDRQPARSSYRQSGPTGPGNDGTCEMAKYLLLIYGNEQTWDGMSAQERSDNEAGHAAFAAAAGDAVLAGHELRPTTTATSLRGSVSGRPTPTDGPFPETKEALGGYYVVEAPDLDAAITLAERLPELSAPHSGVEIRPIHEPS